MPLNTARIGMFHKAPLAIPASAILAAFCLLSSLPSLSPTAQAQTPATSPAGAQTPQTPQTPQDTTKTDAPQSTGLFGSGGETTIYADKQAEFDSKAKKAIFTGNVRVKDAEFFIKCDKLTVYIDENREGLKTAEAEGNVRLIQEKKKPGGETQTATGRSKRLLYDAKLGEARLLGRPQVQQGINLHIADSDSTIMILRRDGTLETIGSSRTVINPEGKPDEKPDEKPQETPPAE